MRPAALRVEYQGPVAAHPTLKGNRVSGQQTGTVMDTRSAMARLA